MVYLHQHNRCKSNTTFFFSLHDSRRPVKIIAIYRDNPKSFLGDPHSPKVSAVWSFRRCRLWDKCRPWKIRWVTRKDCFTAGRDWINRQIRYLRARSICVFVGIYWFDCIFRDDFSVTVVSYFDPKSVAFLLYFIREADHFGWHSAIFKTEFHSSISMFTN